MINNKFNGYSRDGIRLYNDPVTAAAFTAGMSSGTMAGTALLGTGAAAGSTAALGAAGTAALGAAGTAAAAPALGAMAPEAAAALSPEIAANLASAGAPQGIMQGAQGASAVPGAVPAVPPPPAAPLNPAGGDQAIQAFQQAAADPNRGVELGKVAGPADGSAFGNPSVPLSSAGSPFAPPPPPPPEIAANVVGQQSAGGIDSLGDGFMKAMKYAKDNSLYATAALYGTQKLGIMGGDEEPGSGKRGKSADLSNFTASTPSPYLYGFADGGSVSNSPMNTVGGNANYPMSQQRVSSYTRPNMQNPMPQNVLDVSGAGMLDPYTGMPSYGEGGKVSFFEKVMREDEERMAQARKTMREHTPDVSGPGIFRRTLAQEQGRPDQVAASQFASAAKRSGVKVIEMPKANMPEDFTYEAAAGGIMRAANGGPMGRMPGGSIRPSGIGAKPVVRPAPVAAPMARPAPAPAPMARPAPAPAPMARPAPAPVAQPAPSQALVDRWSKAMGPQTTAFLNSQAYQGPRMAGGGITTGLGGYSDGGRLLRGPGDGVSDSIPAVIGNKQPARLADGEFVVPARIVSELGNGSTEAGARKLYAMMERIQKNRRKSVGKGKVAVNSKSDKHLPA
jgi:hypothetical protein